MRSRMDSRIWVFGLLMLLFGVEAMGAGLEARLDRTRVAEGDTVVLTLSAEGDSGGTPDLSPLSKDFDVLDQAQSTRVQVINGRSSSSRDWRITLAPKRAGRLGVPELHLGQAVSEPLSLEVLPAAQAASGGSPRPVMLEVEASPDEPYVQGKVIYTVRLLSRVPLRQASLTEPEAGDAIVERLGEDRRYDTYRDGQNYQVIERRYAIFPQHSGQLEIDPPLLSAQVPETGQGRGSLRDRFFGGRDPFAKFNRIFGQDPFADMDGIFQRTRPVQLRGRRLTLEVRAQPAGTPTPWLPAESLSLGEAWSPDPPVFRVGEPVTRTIAITAQGLTAVQLPDLDLGAVAGVKVYPDKAQTDTRAEGDTLIAQKVLKAALVPSQPGRVTLPEVQLKWWDTASDSARVARLPAREIQVLPAPAGAASPGPTQAQVPTAVPEVATLTEGPPRQAVLADVGAESGSGSGAGADVSDSLLGTASGYWPWLTAAFALAWLVSTGLWWRARSTRQPDQPAGQAPAAPRVNTADALRRVEAACRGDDARAARRTLLDWAAARWPHHPPQRLEELARRLQSPADDALRELDRVLYAGGESTWNGTQAWGRLAPLLRQAKAGEAHEHGDAPLPPLYPQGA